MHLAYIISCLKLSEPIDNTTEAKLAHLSGIFASFIINCCFTSCFTEHAVMQKRNRSFKYYRTNTSLHWLHYSAPRVQKTSLSLTGEEISPDISLRIHLLWAPRTENFHLGLLTLFSSIKVFKGNPSHNLIFSPQLLHPFSYCQGYNSILNSPFASHNITGHYITVRCLQHGQNQITKFTATLMSLIKLFIFTLIES